MKMPRYYVFAKETVYYMKEIEAESSNQIIKMVYDGKIDFDYGDITDGHDFQLTEIEEIKRYGSL
jgi:hypothetical protein